MKAILTAAALLISTQLASAHGLHPVLVNYAKAIELSYEYANHTVGYPETEFTSLIGVSSLQDSARKIRIIKYKFATCAKDLEVYAKVDGSAILSHKVVGCAP